MHCQRLTQTKRRRLQIKSYSLSPFPTSYRTNSNKKSS